MAERNQIAEQICRAIPQMPMAARFAAVWVIKNADPIDRLLEDCGMAADEVKKSMEEAWKKREYKLWALLLYRQFKQANTSGRMNN